VTYDVTRARQREALMEALIDNPGATAFLASLNVPVAPVKPGEFLPASPPMTLILSLLGELERDGLARSVPDPKGKQWYLTGPVRP
jgi:hypothetical protein